MDLAAKHIGFVLASYAVAFVLLAGLILFLVARMRHVRRRLATLQAQGARRRRAAAARQVTPADEGSPTLPEGRQEASPS